MNMIENTKHRCVYTITKKNYFDDRNRSTIYDIQSNLSNDLLKTESVKTPIIEKMSQDEDMLQKFLPVLTNFRDSLAEYQEKRGIPKDETYTFIAMLQCVGEHLYAVMAVMITMFTNLLPITDVFLVMLRFLVDKLIEIVETHDNERTMNCCLFAVEIVPLAFLLLFIYGFILYPLSSMFLVVLNKFWYFLI